MAACVRRWGGGCSALGQRDPLWYSMLSICTCCCKWGCSCRICSKIAARGQLPHRTYDCSGCNSNHVSFTDGATHVGLITTSANWATKKRWSGLNSTRAGKPNRAFTSSMRLRRWTPSQPWPDTLKLVAAQRHNLNGIMRTAENITGVFRPHTGHLDRTSSRITTIHLMAGLLSGKITEARKASLLLSVRTKQTQVFIFVNI